MSEPRRLREMNGSPVERALLSAGASYRSSPAAHAKTLNALGLASSAALSAGVVGATTTSLLSKLGWAKLISLLSLSAALIVPAGYMLLRDSGSAVKASRPAALPSAPATRPEAAVGSAQREAGRAEVVEPAPVESARAVTATARTARPDANAKADSVAAELGVIDGVRVALARGDANGALARLDGYAKAFPRGRLSLEAEVLRIDALTRSGQTAAAAKRAEAFLRRHPNSVLASRVRGYLKQKP